MKRRLLAFCLGLLALAGPLLACASEGELWVAVGASGCRLRSLDGEHWERVSAGDGVAGPLSGVAFGLGHFLAVGGNDDAGLLLTSPDGITWTSQLVEKGAISCLAFGQGRFIAAQGAQILISTDGQTVTPGAKIVPPPSVGLPDDVPAVRRFYEGLEDRGRLLPLAIACGDTEAGFRFVIIGAVLCSTEGAHLGRHGAWRAVVGDGTRLEHFAPTPEVCDIAYGAGHFVAVGRGFIESSHDGQTWVRHSLPGTLFCTVVWTGTRFLASDGATTWDSRDALTWELTETRGGQMLYWARDLPTPLYLGFNEEVQPILSHDLHTWQPMLQKYEPVPESIAYRPATP